jgi:hypothetical protein
MKKKYVLPRNQRYFFYILYNVYPAALSKINFKSWGIQGFPLNDSKFNDLQNEVSGLREMMKDFLDQLNYFKGERISYILYSKDADALASFYAFLALLRPSKIFLWIDFETHDSDFASFEPESRNLIGPFAEWESILTFHDAIKWGDLFTLDEDDIPYVNQLLRKIKTVYKDNIPFTELMMLYARAYGERNYYFKYLLLFMIIESLVSDNDTSGVVYKIRRLCATLIGTTIDQSKSIYEGAAKAYNIRSKLVHAAKFNVEQNFLQFVHSMVCEILLLLLVTGINKGDVFALSMELGFGKRQSLIQDKRFKKRGLIAKNRDNLQYPFPPPPPKTGKVVIDI